MRRDHARHPKAYLEDLLDRVGIAYQETKNGAAALAALDWQSLLDEPTRCRFARSLFVDLTFPNHPSVGCDRETAEVTYAPQGGRDDIRVLKNC